ncbi:DUF368 domain-containing protein [Leptobacterium sp. I13]|uniref:DUF368 domain-containing protein n=1 Tax=Leptobacterium meishanense TaxID=3128904 RepID=UPI0030EB3E4D
MLITLKGMAMGAADIVPGVSGGTIAFISGIYEELIATINGLKITSLKKIWKEGFRSFWNSINGNFLSALLSGIFLSILSLAKAIKWLLENEPVLLWGFFFGLVIASILIIIKGISKWNITMGIFLIVGTLISYYITIMEPTSSPDSFLYLFFSGFIAIIAMILPGVSGAFILLILGAYSTAIGTVNLFLESVYELNFNKFTEAFLKFISLVLGAVLGLKVFSKILGWMFENYKNSTLALLTGFMIGSLNKIWPWKKTISWYTNSHGAKEPLLQKSIIPTAFEGDPKIIWTISLIIIGFLTIFLLERIASKTKKHA